MKHSYIFKLSIFTFLVFPLISHAFSIGGYKFDFNDCKFNPGFNDTSCSAGHIIYNAFQGDDAGSNAVASASQNHSDHGNDDEAPYSGDPITFGNSLRIHWKPKADFQDTFKFAVRSDLKNVSIADVVNVIYEGGQITGPSNDRDGGIRYYGEKLGGAYPPNKKIHVILPSSTGVFFTVKNPGARAVIEPDLVGSMNDIAVSQYLTSNTSAGIPTLRIIKM